LRSTVVVTGFWAALSRVAQIGNAGLDSVIEALEPENSPPKMAAS
jgi:hypothetical protein